VRACRILLNVAGSQESSTSPESAIYSDNAVQAPDPSSIESAVEQYGANNGQTVTSHHPIEHITAILLNGNVAYPNQSVVGTPGPNNNEELPELIEVESDDANSLGSTDGTCSVSPEASQWSGNNILQNVDIERPDDDPG
jgi:hypothetical protein